MSHGGVGEDSVTVCILAVVDIKAGIFMAAGGGGTSEKHWA